MSWIQDVLDSYREAESPDRYFWWSGIAAISAVCKRNIFLDRYYYILYPNIYVLLVGPSGLKKSIPMGMAEKLVKTVDATRVYSGRGTIQGIIKDLGKLYTHRDKKTTMRDARAFVCAGEFDTMLVEDDHAWTLMTDLYDTHFKDEWKNIIKSAGVDELQNIYLVVLGASNETNLKLALPESAIKGGFIGRTLIVLEEETKCINPLTQPPKVIPDIKKLSNRLIEISKLSGQFVFASKAKSDYELWYADLQRVNRTDDTGTLNRLGDTVLKVAMNISMSHNDDLVLLAEDLAEAIEKCEACVPDMRRVFLGHGHHNLAEATAAVLKVLLTRKDHMIARRSLLVNLYGLADAFDLDRIIDTLCQSGAVCSERVKDEIVYKMDDKVVEQYATLRRRLNQ